MAQFQVNPMQLIQMIKSGKNPQQLMLSLLGQKAKENPMLDNLYQMAKSNDEKGIETFARNLAKTTIKKLANKPITTRTFSAVLR